MITRLKILIIAGFVFISFLPASATDVSGKIIGGTEATDGEYPFVVAILDTTNGATELNQQFCGGTLIAADWVLTAAHCMEDYTTATAISNLRVLAGTNVLSTTASTSGTKVRVSAVYVHESYNSVTFNNDIALLKLSTSLSEDTIDGLSSTTYPAFSVGTLATVAGWGTTAYPDTVHTYPTDLMEVDLPVVSNTTCSEVSGYSMTDNMLCAGYAEGGKDSCYGDSGGPLFVQDGSNYIVIGIVSNGYQCAQPNYYGIYTRVSQYTSWIDGKMNGTTDDGGSTDSGDTDTDVDTVDSGGGGGGGCSASKDGSPIALILMFTAGGIYLIRRRRA